MASSSAVPIVVHSPTRDPVERLNSLLRNDGLAVHCTWIPEFSDIADGLDQLNPELLFACGIDAAQLVELATLRDQLDASLPLLVLRDECRELDMAADIAAGARDTVSLRAEARLRAVVRRELRAFRIERTLTNTLRTTQDYRNQLESVMRRSRDAVAFVQEGIIVEASTAWLELFAIGDRQQLIGQPVMDFFAADTKQALRAALAACQQGRWLDRTLKVSAQRTDGRIANVDLALSQAEYESEPCVQIVVPATAHDEQHLSAELSNAVHQDAVTGLWTRRYLLQLLGERLGSDAAGGARFTVCLRPDEFASLERDVGLAGAEDVLSQFAAVLRSMLGPNDVAGHLSGATFLVLLERGNTRDAAAWCESFLQRIAGHDFRTGSRTLTLQCSAGMSTVPGSNAELNVVALEALDALRSARTQGGNALVQTKRADYDTRVQAYDQIWERHLKSALAENRFRLVQQPVASLNGDALKIFDIAVRMLDQQQKEVLPSEFVPAAARNDLLRSIDRWVIAASLALAARTSPDLLFVRLSADSVRDLGFIAWLDGQLKNTLAEPQRICIQVTEDTAARYPEQIKRLVTELRQRRVRVALEHLGTGRDPAALLAQLDLDYAKIDGSLMQGLTGDPALQSRVQGLVAAAKARNMQTVAERIEDANTMAVVWQLGVQYIQGYLVHAPEEVVLKS